MADKLNRVTLQSIFHLARVFHNRIGPKSSTISRRVHIIARGGAVKEGTSKTKKGPHKGPTIIVHGGAGDIPGYSVSALLEGVKTAAKIGYQNLLGFENVADAVETAIRSLEADETFNAGYGSYLNEEGEIEMDACIMLGHDYGAGNVTSVKDVAHPISLARLIMEKTPHVVLAGEGARSFAKEMGMEILKPGQLVSKKAKSRFDDQKHGTVFGAVGAVALNDVGDIAAGASCGGQNRKMVGTSSDIAKIGSGIFADNHTAGVAAAGHALCIGKYCCAYTIAKSMEFGLHPVEAIERVLHAIDVRLQAQAGAVCIPKSGDPVCVFSTKRMIWAYKKGDELHYGSERGEHQIEKSR